MTKMKVLVALDISDSAQDIVAFLRRLPGHESMEVMIVTVVNPPEFGVHGSLEAWYPEFTEHQNELVAENQEKVAAGLRELSIEVSLEIVHGHVGSEIVEAARAWNADWIMVGATHHTAVGRLLLGSVSDYVVTHAKCTVLVLRPHVLRADELLKITLAYDDSPSAKKALQEISSRKWPTGTGVQIAAALTRVIVYRDDLFPDAQVEDQRRRKHVETYAKQAALELRNCDGGVQIDVVEGEHHGETIISAAESFGSQLIVVGDKGHNWFERMLLGSTSRYVLHHAPKFIMVVR